MRHLPEEAQGLPVGYLSKRNGVFGRIDGLAA